MIKYQGVTIEREAQTLFSNIDFEVHEGEFIYLIGKVGTGKSSLLKTIYAELPIAGGDARVFEYDLTRIKRSQIPYLRRKLGIIFQDFQLLTDRTVRENLDFVLKATGWKSRRERDERIKEVLDLVDMETKAWRMPNTLSGGEQQRVVIARSLLNKPNVILADEPTGNLDPETGRNIVALLYEICKSQNTAVVMSTHNMNFLDDFPGRVVRVENEKLIVQSSQECPEETRTDQVPDFDDSNMSEDHCSQSGIQLEEKDCNEQSDQTPSESEQPTTPCIQ